MNLRTALEQLPEAELTLAHFNAMRTTPALGAADIFRGRTQAFAYLVDVSRPGNSYYNRAVTRTSDALSAPALAELPRAIAAIETKPGDLNPGSCALLLESGFVPSHQICYLGSLPSGVQPLGREVVRLQASQADEFLDLLELEGIEFPPAKRDAKRKFYCTEQFQAFVARTPDGTACGWSTLFAGDCYTFFGNSYTRPEFRRSGTHRALLAARLNAASVLGARVAYTDVLHQSQSHFNCERAGFRTLTVNTVWVRQR